MRIAMGASKQSALADDTQFVAGMQKDLQASLR